MIRGVCLFVYIIFVSLPGRSQNRYEVVIDEIMADPSPVVGLPNSEWIELKNTGTSPLNLQNWRIGDAAGQSGPLPSYLLQPDSFVIICSAGSAAALSAFGATLSVSSFPSLDNDGDQLFLRAANGKTIHAVAYSSGWYRNDLKKEGGWSLEMTDPKNPCAGGSNWKAGIHPNGGTPGKKNSTDALNTDTEAPQLIRAYSSGNRSVVLVFDEPLDSLAGATLSNYTIDGGISLQAAVTLPPLFNEVQLNTATPMPVNTLYHIRAANLSDCRGNRMTAAGTVRAGIASDPDPGECVVNEILFNPRDNAYDYVEFFNNSHKIVDASRLYIANRSSNGTLGSPKPLSPVPFLVFPGDYIIETEDENNLARQYLVKNPGQVLPISAPPSFPDEEGTVIALNFQGTIVDEVHYKDDWHFKLIDNPEGVSLERIDPDGPSQDPSNWHSAASTAGYGTPGYKNSQYKLMDPAGTAFRVEPSLFSPDNDGRDDIATLRYEVSEPGFVANITIFDAAGRPVRTWVRNGTMGLQGYWNWDGLGDRGQQLPVGLYIIFTEIFNLAGKKSIHKNTVVLARKF